MNDFTQLSLGDFVRTRPRPGDAAVRPEPESLDARYTEWRESENGNIIFEAVLRRALRLHRSGWKHYGIGAIAEVVRYAFDVRVGPDAEGFKLNNSYRSRMAREMMDRVPELDGFFELRRLRS